MSSTAAKTAGKGRFTKPRHEVADVFQKHGQIYRNNHSLPLSHLKVMRSIETCRTDELGGHLERCCQCGHERNAYNSCRNRHCPKCQALTKAKWLEERKAELLPVNYFHNVFTIPHELNPIILCNKKIIYDILFRSVADTLKEFASDPKHGLGGKLGFIAILHTWNQKLLDHTHLHCLIPAGVLSFDDNDWINSRDNFLFPVRALSKVFRGKFMEALKFAFSNGMLVFPEHITKLKKEFSKLTNQLWKKDWVVYSKAPFHGPGKVLDYLGRYTHRVAIANHRILDINNNAYFAGVNVTGSDNFTAAALIMGIGASVTLTQSDGTVTVEDLILGAERDGGRSTYEMDGGTLNVADSVYVGKNGNGIFRQNNVGTNVTIGNNLYIGGYAGSTGTYTISGGNLDVRNGNIYVGLAGTGTLDVNLWTVWADEVVLGDNGTFTTGPYARLRVNQLTGFFEKGVNTFGHLQIGHSGGRGEANWVMPEGLDFGMKSFTIGYDAKGTFIQDHGIVALTDSLYVGQESGGDGTYELSGTGQLDIGNGMCVGNRAGGIGTFKQNGGSVRAAHLLQVYPDSIYELNAGQCVPGGYLVIQGGFHQAGGNIQVGGGWFLEVVNIYGGGIYNMSGGSLVTPDLVIGNVSTGTMNVTDAGASIIVSNKLSFGPQSIFTAVPGVTIHMAGSAFENESTSPDDLAGLTNLTLIFEGDSEHIDLFEVAGEDMGAVLAGFDSNFALGTLQLGGDGGIGNLQLVNLFDNQPGWIGAETLYVENLVIGAGSSIDLNGLNLYCKTLTDFGGTINLNGGTLTQIPEPTILSIIALSSLVFLKRKYGKGVK